MPVLKNDLESAALTRYPEIGRMKEELLAAGGQGGADVRERPVTFGLFSTKKEAERTEKTVDAAGGWKTIVTRGI